MKKKNITLESMVSQIDDIVASDIDDEKVMMSVEKGQYYGLEPVGSHIWDLIEAPTKVSEIIDGLLVRYGVDRQTCEQDVLAFLEELHEAGIVQVEG